MSFRYHRHQNKKLEVRDAALNSLIYLNDDFEEAGTTPNNSYKTK